jgi:hypothetical protein
VVRGEKDKRRIATETPGALSAGRAIQHGASLSAKRAAEVAPPGWSCFLTQSVEAIENKEVVFLRVQKSAKKCKRVRKNLKRKDLNTVASDE